MAYFAKVLDGKVVDMMKCEPEWFDTFIDSSPGTWIETDKRTSAGVHKDGGTPLRKNYAGIGFTYDTDRDAFIPPKPFDSWTLNEDTCRWEPPVAYPTGEDKTSANYTWNEETQAWDAVETE